MLRIIRTNNTNSYLFFGLFTEIHVATMQTKICWSCKLQKSLIRPRLSDPVSVFLPTEQWNFGFRKRRAASSDVPGDSSLSRLLILIRRITVKSELRVINTNIKFQNEINFLRSRLRQVIPSCHCDMWVRGSRCGWNLLTIRSWTEAQHTDSPVNP
jgi:hypothetical protein